MIPPIKISSPTTGEFWEIPVLYEDDDLLALDKPGNILTTPEPDNFEQPNLCDLLHAGIRDGKPWATSRNLSYLANGHRLDFEISGTLLLAKNERVREGLNNLFGSEKPLLECLTLVRGVPEHDLFEVKANLIDDANRPGLMKTDLHEGKKAVTQFEVMERYRGWSLLRCFPLTQRPHQIRVHLGEIKHPVAGDRAYGGRMMMLSAFKEGYRLKPGRKERPLIGSPLIHAVRLSIPHPGTGDPLVIESEWPKELKVAVKYLRQYASI